MAMYFIPDKDLAWVAATHTGQETTPTGISHFMTKPDGSKTNLKDKQLQLCETVTQATLDSNPPNLVDLESFSEGIILHMCKKRFMTDDIYTFVGTILVAVNPFQRLNIYTENIINKFRAAARRAEPLEPHVFAVAALALEHMQQHKKSQSVLISGESGAGKTESTKHILQYLADVAGKESRRSSSVNVGQQILQSNPILESFGNAKTGRNNNSSRFGKYMEINFLGEGKIKGCRITNYLLEKSRVVFQIPNERNYHVFYMLLNNPQLKSKHGLEAASNYHYLNQSGCTDVPSRNEGEEMSEMIAAFNTLEFTQTNQDNIFEALAGILNLGNIKFAESCAADGTESVSVVNPDYVSKAAKLLGLNGELLTNAITTRKVVLPSETIFKPLTGVQARDMTDALSKGERSNTSTPAMTTSLTNHTCMQKSTAKYSTGSFARSTTLSTRAKETFPLVCWTYSGSSSSKSTPLSNFALTLQTKSSSSSSMPSYSRERWKCTGPRASTAGEREKRAFIVEYEKLAMNPAKWPHPLLN